MNDRERFLSIARFERPGDPYDVRPWIWLETIERWRGEGLPREANPLLAQGGYFPILDHYAPPDISFQNYLYYKVRLKSLRTAV
jgi:hypothetical protein